MGGEGLLMVSTQGRLEVLQQALAAGADIWTKDGWSRPINNSGLYTGGRGGDGVHLSVSCASVWLGDARRDDWYSQYLPHLLYVIYLQVYVDTSPWIVTIWFPLFFVTHKTPSSCRSSVAETDGKWQDSSVLHNNRLDNHLWIDITSTLTWWCYLILNFVLFLKLNVARYVRY